LLFLGAGRRAQKNAHFGIRGLYGIFGCILQRNPLCCGIRRTLIQHTPPTSVPVEDCRFSIAAVIECYCLHLLSGPLAKAAWTIQARVHDTAPRSWFQCFRCCANPEVLGAVKRGDRGKWPHLGHKTLPVSCIFGGTKGIRATESAGLVRCTANSIPTAPPSFLIHFTGLAKSARQQKAALTAGQRRRASKTSRHGWQADPMVRWKWRDCNAGGFPCCSALSVPKLFRDLFTISNRKSPLRLVACLGFEPEAKLLACLARLR
jgi:hypothetical protein